MDIFLNYTIHKITAKDTECFFVIFINLHSSAAAMNKLSYDQFLH